MRPVRWKLYHQKLAKLETFGRAAGVGRRRRPIWETGLERLIVRLHDRRAYGVLEEELQCQVELPAG